MHPCLIFKIMKRNYTVAQQFIARLLLISLCLQSCGDSDNLPIQGGEDPSPTTTIEQAEGEQGRSKRARLEIGTEQGEEQGLILHQTVKKVALASSQMEILNKALLAVMMIE
ncbi:hypothetical protein GR268_42620 [Rhizobium leguminosarum]|nr:hypothetical protein [Rhizobium leguminosarum]